ncbi:MAG TPA: hypothetical protein VLE95_05140 [Chlamydiales bacterium]|nr:hypothetical protein [Chlamydiales bacterium]
MEKKQFERNWNQLKSKIQNHWNRLTTDDLNKIDGMFDHFVNQLVKRYGYSRDTALQEIENWSPNVTARESAAEEFQPPMSGERQSKIHEWKEAQHAHEKQKPADWQQKKRKVG